MWIIKNSLHELQVLLLAAALILHLPWLVRRFRTSSALSNLFPPIAGALGVLLLLVVTIGDFSEPVNAALLFSVGAFGFGGLLVLLTE